MHAWVPFFFYTTIRTRTHIHMYSHTHTHTHSLSFSHAQPYSLQKRAFSIYKTRHQRRTGHQRHVCVHRHQEENSGSVCVEPAYVANCVCVCVSECVNVLSISATASMNAHSLTHTHTHTLSLSYTHIHTQALAKCSTCVTSVWTTRSCAWPCTNTHSSWASTGAPTPAWTYALDKARLSFRLGSSPSLYVRYYPPLPLLLLLLFLLLPGAVTRCHDGAYSSSSMISCAHR
jgi:hypothetical protein